MTLPVYIPTTDPLCQELQGGHDSYSHGLLIADGHTAGPDGGWLIEAPEVAELAPGYRRPEETTANVHPLLHATGQQAFVGRKVYGIRFWTTTTN